MECIPYHPPEFGDASGVVVDRVLWVPASPKWPQFQHVKPKINIKKSEDSLKDADAPHTWGISHMKVIFFWGGGGNLEGESGFSMSKLEV